MKRRQPRLGVIIIVMSISLLAAICPAAASEGAAGAYGHASIPDLIEKASTFEGKRIEVDGEVIGDKLRRADGVWVTLLADGAAIGVFLSTGDALNIATLGSYARVGDLIRVQGVFHRACAQHGGDLDLHAEKVTKLAGGRTTPHAVAPGRIFWSVALCLSGATLAALWRLRERRRRNA